ncbi:MAG: T9SS type A sorting domain-containing protein [Bacteroidota bacterium]
MKNLLLLLFAATSFLAPAQLPTFEYAFSFGGDSRGEKILHSPNGNYLVVGEYNGTLDLDPSASEFSKTSIGSQDIFISAHAANGDFLWGDSYGSLGYDDLIDARIANDGSIYIVAVFEGFIQWGGGTYSSNGSLDIAIAKLSANGEVEWVKIIGGDDTDFVSSFEITDEGNLLLWGQFLSTVDFDLSEQGTFNLSSDGEGFGQGDLFLASYSADGDFQFAKSTSGDGFIESMEIVKMPDNKFLLSAGFNESIDIDLNSSSEELLTTDNSFDVFLAQIDEQGNLLWSGQLEGSSEFENDGGRCILHSISVSNAGEVYISGAFDHTVDFDPSEGVFEYTEEEPGTDFFPGDGFLMKLGESLDFEWMKYINGYMQGSTTVVENNGNILMSGTFHGIDVDINTDENEEQLVSTGDFIYADFQSLLISLDPEGNFLAGETIGAENLRTGIHDISIAPDGQTVMTGSFDLTVDFDFGDGTFELSAEDDLKDAFVLSVDGDPLVLSTHSAKDGSKGFVYPNPAIGFFKLQLDNHSLKEVRLTDLNGRTIKYWQQARGEYRIEDLPSGIYLIHWQGSDQFGSQVLMKK